MALYSPKLLEKKYKEKKYNNWVKAQLAVLFTKDGLKPFVYNEIQQFQQKCLDDICYNNGILSGTICSGCSTENVVKCPSKGVCIVRSGQCSFHRNSNYIPAGCPNGICHYFRSGIQKAHRYHCPSYKNTDATQWCSNSWEVAKCFMPPDGYKDKVSATETDFNGIVSVILNYKDFERKVHENLKIFEEAREIGRTVRHSSTLEVEDSDLQKYFQLLQIILSDPVYLATDIHAQNSKQKLTQLENDTLVIGKDDIRKVLDDVAKAVQDKMKAGLDEQYDRIKLDIIKRKQERPLSLQSQIELQDKTDASLKRLKEEGDASLKRLKEGQYKKVETIHKQGVKRRADLVEVGNMLEKVLKIESKNKREEEYIDSKQNTRDDLITEKMATASPGQVGAQQNRCRLFRLQMLIIDGGLQILRNILDKKLQNVCLSAFLQEERSTITKLRSCGVITQVQYDVLFPSGGSGPATTDLDITLIICLLRNIKSFGLNKNFQWNSIPAQGDISVEADISRLKIYRNEVSHISSTSGIRLNVFITKWTEIEQVLLRLNTAVSPIPDLQKMIDDFKVNPLDPQVERRIQKAIDSWQMLEKGVEADLKLLKMEDEKIKCTLKVQGQTVKKHAQSIDELKKKTCEHDEQIHDHAKQIQELKLKEETRKDDNADTESTYEESKNKLKDELITWYNNNQSTVPLSPLTDAFPTPLAGFYIMPEIDIQTNLLGRRKETTRVKSLQGLFTSGRKVPHEIYLSAAAGFGKTAFSKYLAITWCQAHKKDENYNHFKEEELKALSGFEFLFLVLLRDSAKECDVDDMIEQQVIQYLPHSSSMPKGLLKDILRDEKCLVILDGLDEWTHPDNDCTRLPKSIPHRYAREKCIILTTTPPWKLGVSNLKISHIDKTVELVKLNKDNARQFKCNAMKMLNVNLQDHELKNEVCRFEEAISDHDLEDMESTPLLLLYLICLWIAKIPIGNSAVRLYTGIIQLLLSRTEKLHGKFHSSCETSLSNVPKCFRTHLHFCSYYTFLLTIGKLAFYTLLNKKKEHTLVFKGYVAEKYLNQEDMKSGYLSGILSESKVKTLINESSKISFSHKTVQEFFSAMFISFQNTSEVQKIIFEECNCLQNILDMSKVFVFISGMNFKLMSAISSDFMPVINNDEKISKYRTLTGYDYMYIKPLEDIQDMYISCFKESQENKDLKLCLQDFIINEKCQQENYFKQLQRLYQQNKENIKSIMIHNKGICSVQEIISFLTLSDLPHIEKLYYKGEIVGEEIMSLLLNPLKCLTVISSKWENHQFVGRHCQLSAEINGGLVKLQHLECLNIDCFTMTHEVMETLLNFLTSKKSMKEITLDRLYCSDHKNTSCRGFNLDLSQHSQLRRLGLTKIPVSQLNMDVSLLEECRVGELYKPGVVSSYLSQLPAASKLQTFQCSNLESSSDIETMLQTLSLLYHVKGVGLWRINLGERSLTLSPQMINIERVDLYDITMSCSVLYDLITVINKLPHTVTVYMRGCNIKPVTEFENCKTFIKRSDNFVVTDDGTWKSGEYLFAFKTTNKY